METKVQLKHPAGKKAVSMNKDKYHNLKNAVLEFLNKNGESTHEEICNAATADFKKNKIKFEGSVPWHAEWVKLDLEAKKEIKKNSRHIANKICIMVSEAKDVDDYLKEVPEKRKKALTTLRQLCKDILVGYEETMAYKMPAYKRNNAVEIGFASQKNFIAFYVAIHEVMLSNIDLLKGLRIFVSKKSLSGSKKSDNLLYGFLNLAPKSWEGLYPLCKSR